jgi:hypothetical protein
MSKKKVTMIVLLIAFLGFIAAVIKADKIELPSR